MSLRFSVGLAVDVSNLLPAKSPGRRAENPQPIHTVLPLAINRTRQAWWELHGRKPRTPPTRLRPMTDLEVLAGQLWQLAIGLLLLAAAKALSDSPPN